MTAGEDVWQGVLYRVDEDDEDAEEELLIAMEVARTKGGWIHIHWLWLTGPDAGTSFVGSPTQFNQQLGVTRVL